MCWALGAENVFQPRFSQNKFWEVAYTFRRVAGRRKVSAAAIARLNAAPRA